MNNKRILLWISSMSPWRYVDVNPSLYQLLEGPSPGSDWSCPASQFLPLGDRLNGWSGGVTSGSSLRTAMISSGKQRIRTSGAVLAAISCWRTRVSNSEYSRLSVWISEPIRFKCRSPPVDCPNSLTVNFWISSRKPWGPKATRSGRTQRRNSVMLQRSWAVSSFILMIPFIHLSMGNN